MNSQDISEPLHSYQVSKEDALFLQRQALVGTKVGDDVTVELPSGRQIRGAEYNRWVPAKRAQTRTGSK